ncbi:phosphotransferase family protein [Nocardia miyunensis]|uniref:phosphotransferase family protein n=1 Tax=Nocardia miyunensis TaxID=282684 RepID=UPI00082DCDF3|nr:phosphotransferase family protein [Nocardia miyunensis]
MNALTSGELKFVPDRLRRAGGGVCGPLSATLIAGGRSNLTFRLDDGTSSWVLRMPPRSGRPPSAHDVAREFRVIDALARTDVPVAKAVLLCEEESVVGLPFAVAEFVEGVSVQSRFDLSELDDNAVSGSASALVESLVALHSVDYRAAGLGDFGRLDEYAERLLRCWASQWELVAAADPELLAVAEELRSRLAKSLPGQRCSSVVHGDFRIDNTILRIADHPIRVAAIVDWELSTIGDPAADVAMMCAYRHPALDLILGTKSAWTSDRLPDPDGLTTLYRRSGGVDLVDWEFHLALAHFKIAVIAAGIDHRYRVGGAAGPGFDTAADAVGPLLAAGVESLGVRS